MARLRAPAGAGEGDPEVGPARELCLPSPLVPASAAVADLAAGAFPPGRPLVEAVVDLCGRVHPGRGLRAGHHHRAHPARRGHCPPGAACARTSPTCWWARPAAGGWPPGT